MTSINTNNSAMAALQTLRSVGSSLNHTQNVVSSGYRVQKASDNAAYWSIATTMRSDNKALGAVEDAMGISAAKVDTAYTAMDSAIDVMSEIKAKLVAATEKGVDKTKVGEELEQLKDQLKSISQSASFSGQNWLYKGVNAPPSGVPIEQLVSSFNRGSNGTVSVGTIAVDVDKLALISDQADYGGLLTMRVTVQQPNVSGVGTTPTDWFLIRSQAGSAGNEMKLTSSTTTQDVQGMLMAADTYLTKMTSFAAKLGAVSARIDQAHDFVTKLSDSIDSGVGRLVDANMEDESSRLSALQTQQQLAIQSLSIANSSSQNLLSLFRG
ncbi:flagellin [Rhizobium sp. WYJ-E13]|uniref:flagellin N-terminal helical domain-containing protein n=1 Tax=unclassified Rhizobium TaxID=2613769 RepID=UPI001C1EFD26|nr:flagellin [Rhizobium sp. WYJ-E13]QWW69822.1 flagellin [Rhizobium sp. WYJ-E13]